ncbi:GNAT family N-acetyltransferase [Rhizobium sp. LjRoot254]|uniref:GNAT family N-acetyltransferase n=1 Tax=Rhizobium sp. LjRoot254 TaxID=3342297 RepID=UPI003ECC85F1
MNQVVPISAAGAEQLEIVRTSERLREIGPAWTELWTNVDGLIFQSHDWISAWWETASIQAPRSLRIGLVWHGDRLAAVVPLAIGRRKGLRFLEWAAVSVSDYGDILMAPDCPPSALLRIWSRLSASGGFDLAFLNRLRPHADALGMLASDVPGGIRLRPNHRTEVSHRITGTWQNGAAWYDGLSKKTRKNYRHGCNTLEKSGKLQFRLLAPDEPLEPVLDRIADLKRKWLVERDRRSSLFDQEKLTLHKLVAALARRGVLRLFVLECDGVVIAASVNFVQKGTLMCWVTTYDPEFGLASPGTILIMDYTRWSFDNGLQTVDFLCGGEAFKERFATESVTLNSVIGTRTLRGMLAERMDRIRRALRRDDVRSNAESLPQEA